MPTSSSTTKFGFRIRTRQGLVVEHLMIHGRSEADAERKLIADRDSTAVHIHAHRHAARERDGNHLLSAR